ncbi:MAG: hypothetical protein JXB25_10715 [Deltaproteobacteria bacterium]|nr:hypothetical protein [Deltaproteobacteria bacterium]
MLKKIINYKNIAVFLFFLTVCYCTFFYQTSYGKDPSLINPEIYPTFQEIFNACNAMSLNEATKNCLVVVDIFPRCLSGDLNCPTSDYYRLMENLGYPLPALYLK